MENLRTLRKAKIYCLSRPDSQESSHKTLLPEINEILKDFFSDISLEKGFSRPNEHGKDFIFIFCEGVSGNVEEGDVKFLVDAIQRGCSKTFDQCTVQFDNNSKCQGNVLLVLKMKGVEHVEIFSSFPNYQFTLV